MPTPSTSLPLHVHCTYPFTAMDGDNNKEYNNEVSEDDSRRNRLPSFAEVLARKTRPPVDLFMF